MRKLLVLRGIPASGKSTFIKDHNLSHYTISSDQLRLKHRSPVLKPDGLMGIDQRISSFVFDELRAILKQKMADGEFVVIDATNTDQALLKEYLEYAKEYRYEPFLVDFGSIDVEESIRRNAQREEIAQVPEFVMRQMDKKIKANPVPEGYIIITPEEFDSKVNSHIQDFSRYQSIHHIGDIQGAFEPLYEYFEQYPYVKEELFIFTGDLVDRGSQNHLVVEFVIDLLKKDNVWLIEGNHDSHLFKWAQGKETSSMEFMERTRYQLEEYGINRQEVASVLSKKMIPALHYQYHEKVVLVTHGGLSKIPENLDLITVRDCIRGSGVYEDSTRTDETFNALSKKHEYSIHGHRNPDNSGIRVGEKVFNLEGKVEFGGALRAVILSKPTASLEQLSPSLPSQMGTAQESIFEEVEIPALINPIQPQAIFPEFLSQLRENVNILEKPHSGNISSFNVNRQTATTLTYNEINRKARGLFINTVSGEIVIRSYDVFFEIDQTGTTGLNYIGTHWEYPIKVWKKENGFLGLLGYDSQRDDFVFATKTATDSIHRYWFEQLLRSSIDGPKLEILKAFMRDQMISLSFEVIDPQRDPHIIEYEQPRLVLLDLVKRTPTGERLNASLAGGLARTLGISFKEKTCIIENESELYAWYNKVMEENYKDEEGNYIEGFVLEDAQGSLVKVKLEYYLFWKKMREVLTILLKNPNYIPSYSTFSRPQTAREFVSFVTTLLPYINPETVDIISLRKLFYSFKIKTENQKIG